MPRPVQSVDIEAMNMTDLYFPTKSAHFSRWEGCRHIVPYVITMRGDCFKGSVGTRKGRERPSLGKSGAAPQGEDFEL